MLLIFRNTNICSRICNLLSSFQFFKQIIRLRKFILRSLDFSLWLIIKSPSRWIETTTCPSPSSKVSPLVLSELCSCIPIKNSLLALNLIVKILISLTHKILVLLLRLIVLVLCIVKIVVRWSLLKLILISSSFTDLLKIFLKSFTLNKLASPSLIVLKLETWLSFLLQKLVVWIYLVIWKCLRITWRIKLNYWTLDASKTCLYNLLCLNLWINSDILLIILMVVLIKLRHFIVNIILYVIILVELGLLDLLICLSFNILKWLFLVVINFVLWI